MCQDFYSCLKRKIEVSRDKRTTSYIIVENDEVNHDINKIKFYVLSLRVFAKIPAEWERMRQIKAFPKTNILLLYLLSLFYNVIEP